MNTRPQDKGVRSWKGRLDCGIPATVYAGIPPPQGALRTPDGSVSQTAVTLNKQRMSPPPPTAPRRAGNSHPLPECGAERRPKAIREPGGGGRTQGIWASGSSGCNTRETWPRAWPPGREVTLFCEMPEAHVLPTADVPTGYRARLFQQPSLFTSSRQRWNG